MKAWCCSLLLCLVGFGCARIYRPIAVQPAPVATSGPGLAGQLALQPWGDNSRYEARAREKQLRLLVLTLANAGPDEVEVLGLDLPAGAVALSPAGARAVVKQSPLAYLLYPALPALVSLASDRTRPPGFMTTSDAEVWAAVALVGLCIGVPNALVAAHANRRLGQFLEQAAWRPAPLPPGGRAQGLIYLQSAEPYQPLPLGLRFRTRGTEGRLELLAPALPPPPR